MEHRKLAESNQAEALFEQLEALGRKRPLETVPRDKPDFMLKFGESVVGLEVTLAVAPEYVRAERLQDAIGGEAAITTSLERFEKRPNNSELAKAMFEPEPEEEWLAIKPEFLELGSKVSSCLDRKRAILNGEGFQHFDANWLLITVPTGASAFATDSLAQRGYCEAIWNVFTAPVGRARDFDAVFVRSNSYFFWWEAGRLRCYCQGRMIRDCKAKYRVIAHG